MFSSELAEIRFGCGLSPDIEPSASREALLSGLVAADVMADKYPISPFSAFAAETSADRSAVEEYREQNKLDRGDPDYREKRRKLLRAMIMADADRCIQTMRRWTGTDQGFRERLVFFWADHFTAFPKAGLLQYGAPGYVEEAIRPNMTGRFEDLLIAAVTHPVMLLYLDQVRSAGPGSAAATKRPERNFGVNENLAREVLELHTLGVDGRYSQDDVRQLARLLTGLSTDRNGVFQFRTAYVEPGPKTVLGRTYGGDDQVESIHAALRDLARHPDTARHVAWKLATHFVSDTPETGLVDHVAARYEETGGDLMAVYTAMIEHPASWDPVFRNVKPAADFVGSACRALAVPAAAFDRMELRDVRQSFLGPMREMGQTWQRPNGPDGWPEEDIAWITPQSLAVRLGWAMAAPRRLLDDLPDPRRFAESALGTLLPPRVEFAAKAAEQRHEAIGLVLASPAFQRR